MGDMRGAPGRVIVALSVAALALLSGATPALAKGPVRAVIDGPGLASPIVLSGSDLEALSQGSGLFAGLFSCRQSAGCTSGPPTGNLGPTYTVRYTLRFPEAGSHRDAKSHVVQYLYPQAQPQPLSYLPPGQPFWSQTTKGGSVVIDPLLLPQLLRLGGPTAATTPASPATSPTDFRPALVTLALVGISAAVLFMRTRRRPRTRHAATPAT